MGGRDVCARVAIPQNRLGCRLITDNVRYFIIMAGVRSEEARREG